MSTSTRPLRILVPVGLLALAVVIEACSGGADEAPREGDSAAELFVSSSECIECHAEEFESWKGSHHDLAMQEATEETVLGDFGDVPFEHEGVQSFFFREGEKFKFRTEGPDGQQAEYEVAYVFGVEPLQQYLVEFPGGRMQCLTIAWDVAGERWFHLYPDQRIEPDDALHWTGRYQNWNAMCAECHSTYLRKNYDPATDTFDTTWHEIDVGCQACHGPGREHVEWARGGEDPADAEKGLRIALQRGALDAQIDACAPCHSRRSQIDPQFVHGDPFVDAFRPANLDQGLYHPDGQILDEVYVYGSFVQSRMYRAGVACTDCHDPHSLQPLAKDNALCMQCHTPYAPVERFPTLEKKVYDSPDHHHHEPDSEGALCVNCHMLERTYMVVDPRHDHSFRVPRPDQAELLGTPDACTSCHTDKEPAWAAAAIVEWGVAPDTSRDFAVLFEAARLGDPRVVPGLQGLARDPESAVIVRASALELLANFGEPVMEVALELIEAPEPRLRVAAVRSLEELPKEVRGALLGGLLEDPHLDVRMEAARVLLGAPEQTLPRPDLLRQGLDEYEAAQLQTADLPWSRLNLGRFYEESGDVTKAVAYYEKALELDTRFLPVRFNLATLLNTLGRNEEAEKILREGARQVPDQGEIFYSWGLLLAEMDRIEDAAGALTRAAELMPYRPRVHYNLGLALERIGEIERAAEALERAYQLMPDEVDMAQALAYFYVEHGQPERARPFLDQIEKRYPGTPWVHQMLQRIEAEAASDG